MEENMKDTPQPASPPSAESAFDTHVLNQFGTPAEEGSEKSNLAVEDAFFTPAEKTAEETPQKEQAPSTQETPQPDARNDERRYQYWQSQAAKTGNELEALKHQLNEMQQASTKSAPEEQAEVQQEFPPPPQAPQKPSRFSREEAWNDPQSESARYLDEKESWDGDMGQYNELKHQYDLALMQEKLDAQTTYLSTQENQRQNKIEQGRQISQISEHVQGHYGFNPQETQEFIRTMSNPESISMDNLVQLFRMNQAGGNQPANPTGPSDAFRQERNAQQIPSPMGVMPAQTETVKNDSDSIMDDLINSHKSKNPWT